MFMFIFLFLPFIISSVMNLFMNVSVETCWDFLCILGIKIASELHMGSSLRQVHLFARFKLLISVPCMRCPDLSQFFLRG